MARINLQELRKFETNGAAAYNMYAIPLEQPDEVVLPEERPQQAQKKQIRVRARTGISAFGVLGVAAVSLLLALVIFSYVRLYEATTDVAALESTVEDLTEQNATLTATYESRIDLTQIEQTAMSEYGMSQPTAGQTVYLNLSGKTDKAEIFQVEQTNALRTAWNALRDGLRDLLSYFT